MYASRSIFPKISAPTQGWPLVLLLAIFLLLGTYQHAPWKNEDAAHFGIIWRALQSGDWLYLHFSNSTLPEAPLYYWLGGTCVHFLQNWLDAANAARLATTLLASVSLLALYHAARNFFGQELASAAPLTLVGCLGFLIASHDTQAVMASMTGISLLLLALSAIHINLIAASLILASALSFILLSSGFRLLPALGLLALPLVWHPHRARIAQAVILAGLISGALYAAWFQQLTNQHPDKAALWTTEQIKLLTLHGIRPSFNQLITASWFTWPAWPIALLGLWISRHRLNSPGFLVVAGCSASLLLVLILSGEERQALLLLLLPSLCLLSVPGLYAMRRGVESLFDWFGRMTFSLILLALWLAWTAINWGFPAKWAKKSALLAPGFTPEIQLGSLLLALTATLFWLWIIFSSPRSPLKSLFSWTGGLILSWILAMSLCLPWIEYQRSYHDMMGQINEHIQREERQSMPTNTLETCVITQGMSEAQFANIDYFLNLPLHRGHPDEPSKRNCRYLIKERNKDELTGLGSEWKKQWEGQRPGEKSERYQLYKR